MTFKNYRDQSRVNWGRSNSELSSHDDLKLGSLLRIADACELMAKGKVMSKHTRGPWRWWTSNSRLRLSSDATHADGDVLYACALRDGADVVVVNPADRPLIEAAPDLLQELTLLVGAITEPGRGDLDPYVESRIAFAQDAIAKATRQQP